MHSAGSAAVLSAAMLCAVAAAAEVPAECRSMTEGQRFSVVVPNGPGGGYDTYARALAPVIADLTGASVRVENLPAAGGLAAYRRVVEAQPDEWVIMLEEADDAVRGMRSPALDAGDPPRYRFAAVFYVEPAAWVVRPGFDPMNPPGGRLVAGSSSKDDADEWTAVKAGLGIDWTLIDGYDGTSAMTLALLGKDVDILTVSLGSARKAIKGGDLAIAAVLQEGPHPDFPGVAYLTGPGSIGEARLAALPEAERADAGYMIGVLQRVSQVLRSVVASASQPPERAACLDAVVDAAISSPAFRDAAEAEGRLVDPVPLPEALDMIAKLQDGMTRIRELRAQTN